MKPPDPMLATLADEPFHRPGWVYEEKYDGIRGLAVRSQGDVKLWSRNLIDRSAGFPDIIKALRELPGGDFILDGEVVVFDEQGVSRFMRFHGAGAVFVVFDMPTPELRSKPWTERRAALEKLIPADGKVLRLSRLLEGDGFAAYQYAKAHDWEGIIAKDASSTYEVGKRSRAWLKVKLRKESELVIGGFTAPRGARSEFGALLVGLFDHGGLRYCGKVGTGFDAKTLRELGLKLRALKQPESPFSDAPRFRDATWVKPELVAQLAFHEWTPDGSLRHPAFLGLRDDKSARECTWDAREK